MFNPDENLTTEQVSHELNLLANTCVSVFHPSAKFMASLIDKYDDLDERNKSFILACCMVSLKATGSTKDEIDAIMIDSKRRSSSINKFIDALLIFDKFFKRKIG